MDTSLHTHRSGETDRQASHDNSNTAASGARPLGTILLESRWFYLIAGLAVTCGPFFLPGVGIKEWFLILVGGGVAVYLAILLGGLVMQVVGDRTPRRHGR